MAAALDNELTQQTYNARCHKRKIMDNFITSIKCKFLASNPLLLISETEADGVAKKYPNCEFKYMIDFDKFSLPRLLMGSSFFHQKRLFGDEMLKLVSHDYL
ncbi:hypothetical protein QQP08_013277 [Theobroma cacao]|nr:hypothetical protein QQP08_013277 [Theobroma cacao]